MSKIVKMPVSQLEEGMIVIKFDKGGFSYPHYGRPFPGSQLKQYLERSGVQFAFVKSETIDTSESALSSSSSASGNTSVKDYLSALDSEKAKLTEATVADKVIAPTIKELQQTMIVHERAKKVAEQILVDARMGSAIDTDAAKGAVTELVDQCIKSPEAFVNMTRLKDFDNYTFTHSVNVSVLAIAIGRRLGKSAQEMNNIGFAGLLHDIGKMQIPESILNKPGKLTEEEYQVMKMHTVYGYDYLCANSKEIPNEILKAVRSHHEKSDGSGYPDGLFEKEIPLFAKILSIADVYDAVTSERVYHKGMAPSDALRMIFSWSGKHFNDQLVKFFISAIGIYPVGTLVMLNTNELAIIIEPNKKDPLRPKVIVVSDSSLNITPPVYFDLTSYNITTQTPYKTIVSSLDPRDFSINPNSIIAEYVISRS